MDKEKDRFEEIMSIITNIIKNAGYCETPIINEVRAIKKDLVEQISVLLDKARLYEQSCNDFINQIKNQKDTIENLLEKTTSYEILIKALKYDKEKLQKESNDYKKLWEVEKEIGSDRLKKNVLLFVENEGLKKENRDCISVRNDYLNALTEKNKKIKALLKENEELKENINNRPAYTVEEIKGTMSQLKKLEKENENLKKNIECYKKSLNDLEGETEEKGVY